MAEINTRDMMSEAKFYESYSRWDSEKNRYETWDEAVERVMQMHRFYYKDKMSDKLFALINEAETLYKQKYVLGAQRALQFGGDQLLKHESRLYNCVASYMDRPEFFGEAFYLMLSGCGVGFSVQHKHIKKLPRIKFRTNKRKTYIIEDSIEGWSDALDVLLSSYFEGGGKYPEYEGVQIRFDYDDIRPKGSEISGGFKAPGHEPLKQSLEKIQNLIETLLSNNQDSLKSINAYDILMHVADSVISGGVRRSATICVFSPDDQDMLTAKTGNWFNENPQRGRSNNSALIVRNKLTRDQFSNIMKNIKEFGEPGFIFAESEDHLYNPCVEIGMLPHLNGVSGWQACNLTEINGGKATTPNEFYKSCRVAAILGTLQAGYTNLKFVTDITKKILERESLIGVSITGWMNNPDILFDKEILSKGANIVKETNREVAKLLGINPAARTTCAKPSGNASVILGTSSGIHAEHSLRYFRNVQMNKETEIAKLILQHNPKMVEESAWSANKTDFVISFPIIANNNSIFRESLYGVDMLEKVKFAQQIWVETGTDLDLCVDKTSRHNISNTVSVKGNQWDEVEQYLFDNKQFFAGVSFIGASGDKDYIQAPNTEVLTEDELLIKYGKDAIDWVYKNFNLNVSSDVLWLTLTMNWFDRYHDIQTLFGDDYKKAEYCIKDVFLTKRWNKIQETLTPINFVSQLQIKKFTDINTMGAANCVGTKEGCFV